MPGDDADRFAQLLREWAASRTMFDPATDIEPTPKRVRDANQSVVAYAAIKDRLASTPEGRAVIEALMYDDDPQVRSIAASYAMEWGANDARRVLVEVSHLRGIVGLGAEYALRRFEPAKEPDE